MGRGMKAGKKPKTGGGGGGRKNQMAQMQQLQQMQRQMESMQAELEEKEITATSGGGVVSAVMNGKKELVSLTIDPDVVDPDDVETLQDLVIAAVNEGMRQVDEITNDEYGKLTGGLGIPGL